MGVEGRCFLGNGCIGVFYGVFFCIRSIYDAFVM